MTTDDTIVILGRQPELGIAELESLYGSDKVRAVGREAALIEIMPCSIDFDRLGGAIKLCKILAVLETINWSDIQKFLEQVAPGHSKNMPEGKMQLGLSVYDLPVSPQKIIATGLNLKKAIRKTGRSVRLTPNQEPALNSAQVLHNHLTGPNGWELVFVRDGNKTICAQTLFVQDINSYTLRDRGRPKRDARVGMLPPKLAQTIINLAAGIDELSSVTVSETSKVCLSDAENTELRAKRAERTILDPFCGTGVLLQEALLMGYNALGTDLEPRMVEYSDKNLSWLQEEYGFAGKYDLAAGDATNTKWAKSPDIVACETYLGQPYTTHPSPDTLDKNIRTCNLILEKFLANISQQIQPNTRLCLAIPAWQIAPGQFKHLPLIDRISEMGYNRVSFEHVRSENLLYYREDQIVARELLVITRK